MRRGLAFVLLSAACSPTSPATTAGDVHQTVFSLRAETSHERWVIVVDDGDSPAAAASRATFVRAFRASLTELATRATDVWLDVDVGAVVVGAVGRVPVSAGVTWREADASVAGAQSFADAVERAIDARRASGTADVVDAVRAALRTDGDDGRVISIIDAASRSNDLARGAPADLLPLSRVWFDGQAVPIDRETDPPAWCPSEPIATCAARVFLPAGATCDPARGLRPAPGGEVACELALATAGDEGRCEDRTVPGRGLPGAYCIAPFRGCAYGPRIVGGAVPPGALLELTCDLRR